MVGILQPPHVGRHTTHEAMHTQIYLERWTRCEAGSQESKQSEITHYPQEGHMFGFVFLTKDMTTC